MSIKDMIASISKKYEKVLMDISVASDIVEDDDISSVCKKLLKIGIEAVLYIKNGLVEFSTIDSLKGTKIDMSGFSGLGEIEKYKIAKMVFNDPEMRKFEIYKVYRDEGFLVVFNINAFRYQVALVNLLMKAKTYRIKIYGDRCLKIKTAIRLMYNMDRETYMHSYRTKEYSKYIAKSMGVDGIFGIELGAMLHDIGKLFVPFSILKKEEKLTHDEFEVIKSHPLKSYFMLKSLDFDGCALDVALMHHERIDGSGYPFGIKRVPKCVQIVAISDIIDAIQSSRSYKEKTGVKDLLEELDKVRGGFDNDVFKTARNFVGSSAFFVLKKRFTRISERVIKDKTINDLNVLLEKMNVFKNENANLKKEVDIYKRVISEVQGKYEELVSAVSSKNKKDGYNRLNVSVRMAFELLSKAGNLKTVAVVCNDTKIESVRGEAFDVSNIYSSDNKKEGVFVFDLKNKKKLYAVFEGEARVSPYLKFAIEGLF